MSKPESALSNRKAAMKKILPIALILFTGASFFAQAQAQQQPAPIVRDTPNPPPPPPPPPPPSPDQQQQAAPAYPTPAPEPGDQAPPPAALPPQQLDQIVQRVALYPDPLLAQTLTASTFWYQVADAATWADQHAGLRDDTLSQAIQADNLPWDPSVLALLAFPTVLDMMARDPQWTGALGNAVLVQRSDVMDAVQRQRSIAHNYGYLAPNAYDNVVDDDGDYEILPVNPAYVYVPVYSPGIVFFAPRPGFFIGGALRFGPAIVIGPSFGVFGWRGAGFGWHTHALLIEGHPWGRTFANRGFYSHPYAHPYVRTAGPRVEAHPQAHSSHSAPASHARGH
jgi:hypothetical protein